jgi:hypothetical protein
MNFLKEFAMKHPVMTFLLAASAIDGTVAIVKAVAGIFNKEKATEEEKVNEPAGDIQ